MRTQPILKSMQQAAADVPGIWKDIQKALNKHNQMRGTKHSKFDLP